MVCDIDISKLKPNSVLYRDANGKFICVTKEEFLKELKNEISVSKKEIESIKNYTEETRKSITTEISSQNERIKKISDAMLEFIDIMKGDHK